MICEGLALARARGLNWVVIHGLEGACSADVVVVNGDDPSSIASWIDIRRMTPDPAGLIISGPRCRSDCPSDQILRRPFSPLAFIATLGALRRADRSALTSLPARN